MAWRITAVRVAVHVPDGISLPDRVRLRLKEQDKLFLPLRSRLATVSLHCATWTRTPGIDGVWRADSWHPVQLNLLRLLRLACGRRLAVQVCCLRGRRVQYKAMASVLLLFDQTEDQQLFFNVHYPGCCPEQQGNTVHAAATAQHDTHRLQPLTPRGGGTITIDNSVDGGTRPRLRSSSADNLKEEDCGQRRDEALSAACNPRRSPLTPDAAEPPEPRRVTGAAEVTVTAAALPGTQAASGTSKEGLRAPPPPRQQSRRVLMWTNWVFANTLPVFATVSLLLEPSAGAYARSVYPGQAMFWPLTAITSLVFYIVAWTPPGRVLREEHRSGRRGDAWRLCAWCGLHVPPIARHCRVCAMCVWERDHHCFVVGNCVGRNNIQAFLLLCVLVWACGLLSLCQTAAGVFVYRKAMQPLDWGTVINSSFLLLFCTYMHEYVRRRRQRVKKRFPELFSCKGVQ